MNMKAQKYWKSSILLIIILLILVIYDLSLGSYSLSLSDIFNGIFSYNPQNTHTVVLHVFRLPRVLMAVLAGAALSVAGLLMQTLFQNPLAAPYVLGINSGSALLVAVSTMSSFYFFNNELGLVSAALIGAFLAGILILLSAMYVKSKISLLLIGIMLGSFSGALINVVQSYANPNSLKAFMLWSFGSLQQVQLEQIGWVVSSVFIGILIAFILVKSLNLLLLGDKNAVLLGMRMKQVRLWIITATAILAGIITAFCGPIAFVGLVVPNMIKFLYKTANHYYLLIGCIFGGAILVVVCDIVMHWLTPWVHLPLNALTSLIGAPVVIWIIIRKF